jgi:hypothetical protein
MRAHLILSDEDAEHIGAELAIDFGLKRNYASGFRQWQTASGTFTNKGIARRALRMIEEGAQDTSRLRPAF